MDQNWYDVLSISRTSTLDEIKKAYKKLIIQWHPDKHQGTAKKNAHEKFQQITEAYNEIMKSFNSNPGSEPLNSSFESPWEASNSFFNNFEPYSFSTNSNTQSNSTQSDSTQNLFNQDVYFNRRPKKDEPVIHVLSYPLSDFYCGNVHELKINRQEFDISFPESVDGSNKVSQPIEIHKISLKIIINPWTEENSEIIFESMGDIHPNRISSDIIVILKAISDQYFQKQNSDLVYTKYISTEEHKNGFLLTVPHLDGKNILHQENISGEISLEQSLIIPQKGFLIQQKYKHQKFNNKRGNLIVHLKLAE